MDRNIQLYVYDADYGLPSFDAECIKSILYARVTKVPVSIKVLNGIKSCTFYSGPTLIDGKVVLTNSSDIIKHFRALHYNTDCGMSPKQASDFYAFETLVTTKLNPVLQFIQWIDIRNCEEFVGPWYMRALPFPLNYARVKQGKNTANDMMEALYPNEDSVESLREIMRKQASSTLSIISTRLGDSNYFHGDTITGLDIVVYAYLAPMVKLDFPSNEISSLISMWPNLMNFVKRIDTKYLSDLSPQPKYLKKPDKIKPNDDDISYVTLFVLVTSASTIMFIFALNKGIVKLSS